MGQAQQVLLLLGGSLVVQCWSAVFDGVVVGCHRWGMHNAINAGAYLVTSVAMITALALGGGLTHLAAVVLAGDALAWAVRVWAARHSCPELRIRLSAASLAHAGELIRFGGKTVLEGLAKIVLYQSPQVVIVAYLGPAALALYSRPSSLVRHAVTFMNKFAVVFTPTASAIQAGAQGGRGPDHQPLRELLVAAIRYSLYISLPMVAVLAVDAGPILRLWMGPRYESALVLILLAVGHLGALSQRATYQILMGMGRHGQPSAMTLAAAICAIPLSVLALGPLGWGLPGVALAMVGPLTVANVLVIPLYACRVLDLSWRQCLRQTLPRPLASVTPLTACLLAGRLLWPHSAGAALGLGLLAGTTVTAPIYWRWVLPARVKEAIRRRIVRRGGSHADAVPV
jgi:O-antigen/teichoic acid export membrane protein